MADAPWGATRRASIRPVRVSSSIFVLRIFFRVAVRARSTTLSVNRYRTAEKPQRDMQNLLRLSPSSRLQGNQQTPQDSAPRGAVLRTLGASERHRGQSARSHARVGPAAGAS